MITWQDTNAMCDQVFNSHLAWPAGFAWKEWACTAVMSPPTHVHVIHEMQGLTNLVALGRHFVGAYTNQTDAARAASLSERREHWYGVDENDALVAGDPPIDDLTDNTWWHTDLGSLLLGAGKGVPISLKCATCFTQRAAHFIRARPVLSLRVPRYAEPQTESTSLALVKSAA